MFKPFRIILPLLLLLGAVESRAQLFIDNNYTIDQMINGFFGNNGFTISNITYSGTPASLAFFEGSQSNIGLNAGLLITSGNAELAIGPNSLPNAGAAMNVPGSSWLDALIPGYQTVDASIIEMDIVPASDSLAFYYVFSSEEYLEYVGTQFNDIFAFFVEGPGLPSGDSIWVAADTVIVNPQGDSCLICVDTLIVYNDTICFPIDTCIFVSDTLWQWCYFDPNCPADTIIYPGYWYYSPGGVNIAQIPNTNLPVAINTLNQNQFSQYFFNNENGATVEYDAFTTPLWAYIPVIPGETYHVRIAIADAGDMIFDSGVFLGIESLGGDSLLGVIPNYAFTVQPGNSTTVDFQNSSFWGTKYLWDFGDGTTSSEKDPSHTYALAGVYTVKLTVQNWCSSETYTQEVSAGVSATQEPLAAIFSLLPNPTNNGITTLDLKTSDYAAVRVLAMDGRLLLEAQLNDGARIDLNPFGKGVFLIQVMTDGKIYTDKVVNR